MIDHTHIHSSPSASSANQVNKKMYFPDSQEETNFDSEVSDQHIWSCSQGHRSTLSLQTQHGGAICLLCLSNLVTTPRAPTVHVSYALSNLSLAVSLRPLLSHHAHFLVSPLVHALSSFDDQPIACQLIDIITSLCNSGDGAIAAEFVSRVSDKLSSGALAWSRRQLYMLHCFGVLLNCQISNCDLHIREKEALISNLVTGLALPSEEIQGEILFVLYKVSTLQCTSVDGGWVDILLAFCPKLFRLSLEALMKTQSDDVRLNCIALLTILAQKGIFIDAYANDISCRSDADNFMQATEDGTNQPSSLTVLFAEAIKGALLSSDNEIQDSTLDLIFHYLSSERSPVKQIKVLVEENIADYVLEILRLSGFKDSTIISCLRVLNLFLTAEQTFRQRLVIGFTTLIPVLKHVAEVPFHPVQSQTMKLIWNCISDCPGILNSHVEEVVIVLTKMLKLHGSGERTMLPDTFAMACSIFVVLLKSTSFIETSNLAALVQEASKHAVLSCLNISEKDTSQILHPLSLLKEAYAYSYKTLNTGKPNNIELRNSVVDICTSRILPWFETAINDIDEETVLGILDTFQFILLQDSDIQATEFAKNLVSSSWIHLSFGCLGLFPAETVKSRVYLVLSSLMDVLYGSDTGKPIREAALILPSDPVDLLFLLGQKNYHDLQLSSCQSAVLLILHTSSLYDDRLADEKLILAALEQYILVNSRSFPHEAANFSMMMWLMNLYGLYRNLTQTSQEVPHSLEAERILFRLLTENNWDLPFAMFHQLSLRWLFQQEKISKPLSYQILKFCRSGLNCTEAVVHGDSSQTINEKVIAELLAMGDNYGPSLFTCLLIHLVEQEGQEDGIISIMIYLARAIKSFPEISDQLCLNDIGKALRALFNNPSYSSSLWIYKETFILMLNILSSVHPEVLSDDEAWVAVTVKLTDYLISTVAVTGWTCESLLVTAILSLILHHSTKQALVEASKTILWNTSLASILNSIIDAACSKGPALMDNDDGTSTGGILIFVLLLYYFSLRSLQAAWLGAIDWQSFLDPSNKTEPLSMINISCHNMCRLLHFGSSSVKLVSSYCLLELFSILSDERNREHGELNCSICFLMSIMAVLEGLIFYSDIRVAMNCGLCLSTILGWVKQDVQEGRIIGTNYWCRLVVEELAMSLAVPSLASKSFINHHKPAIYVAVALLRLDNIPGWMRTVFDGPCISGIIGNLGASNMSSEIVLLFRELLNSDYLNAEQIASFNHVLLACRKYMYTNNLQDEHIEKHAEKKMITDDLAGICEYLIHLMSSQSSIDKEYGGSSNGDKRLLDEIELFFKTPTVED